MQSFFLKNKNYFYIFFLRKRFKKILFFYLINNKSFLVFKKKDQNLNICFKELFFSGASFSFQLTTTNELKIKSGLSHEIIFKFNPDFIFIEPISFVNKNSKSKLNLNGIRLYSIFPSYFFFLLSTLRRIFFPKQYSGEGALFKNELNNLVLKKRK